MTHSPHMHSERPGIEDNEITDPDDTVMMEPLMQSPVFNVQAACCRYRSD